MKILSLYNLINVHENIKHCLNIMKPLHEDIMEVHET